MNKKIAVVTLLAVFMMTSIMPCVAQAGDYKGRDVTTYGNKGDLSWLIKTGEIDNMMNSLGDPLDTSMWGGFQDPGLIAPRDTDYLRRQREFNALDPDYYSI